MFKKLLISTSRINTTQFVLYLLVFLLAIYLRFDNSLTALIDEDAEGYIYPALKLCVNGQFDHVFARAYVYPLFLSAILSLFSSLEAIVIVQHMLALTGGLLLINFLEKKTKLFRDGLSRSKKGLVLFINFSFLLLVLCNGHLIYFEKMIRPEGLVVFFSVITLVLLDKYLSLKTSKGRVGWLIILSTTLAIAILLFPRWTLGIYCLFGLIAIQEVRSFILEKKYSKIIGWTLALVLVAVVSLPEQYLIKKYDPSSVIFAYKQFYFSNASAVQKAILEENSVLKTYDEKVVKYNIEKAFEQGMDDKFIIGYPMDYWQYSIGDGELVQLLLERNARLSGIEVSACSNNEEMSACQEMYNATRKDYNSYFKSWFTKLVLDYPFEVFKKTFKQIITVLFSKHYNYFKFSDYHFKQQSEWSFPETSSMLIGKFNYVPGAKIQIEFPSILEYAFNLYNGLIRILFPIVLISVLLKLKRSRKLTSYMMTFLLMCILLVAVFHTFDITRYIYSLSFFICSIIYLAVYDWCNPKPDYSNE